MSINPTLQSSTFLGNNDFTWWLGTVENSDDRDAKLGRVKVNILGFHRSDEKPDNLPWALVMQPTTNPAVGGIGNAANSLKPGSFVMGFFLDYPDCQQPVVMGTFYSQIKKVIEPDTQQARDTPGGVNIRKSRGSTETGQPQESENVVPTAEQASATRAENGGGIPVSDSIAAKSSPASASNPSGRMGSVPIADGKDGPLKVISEQIKMCIEELGNIFKTGKVYQPNKGNPVLTSDVSKEQQYIPVSNVKDFPDFGKIKIGNEEIGYNGKNETSLTNVVRGMNSTKPSAYTKGAKVTYIPKTDSPIEIVGKFTDKVVDVKAAVDRCISIIRNLVWYIVNEVKAQLMKKVTEYLNAIGLASSSPIPYFVKTVTEVVVQVLKTIGCTLDQALVDAIMLGIEGFIEQFVTQLADQLIQQAQEYIDFAEQCINDIFGSIFQLTSVATQIATAVEDIISLFKSISDIGGVDFFDEAGMVNADALLNIGNIVGFILNLLGIGCNRSTESPLQITWDDCQLTENNCNPLNFVVLGGIQGRWNPEYSKLFVQTSEAGHTIVMDDTPHNNRLVIEAGGSKTGFHILDNGDIEVTNSNNKTEVTFGKQKITVKGDAYIAVKGDYHLKVGGNYHLEVDGQYNVFANRESKVTYGGEHETIFKNDSKLSASNGFALAASKLGFSASGQLDIFAPTLSTFCTEQNHLCTGSWNLYALYKNDYIGANKFCLIGGNRTLLRAGLNSDIGTGVSQKYQATAESVWKGGLYNETIIGASNKTKMSVDNKTTIGTTNENLFATKLKNVVGTDFKTMTGLNFDLSEGIDFNLSDALTFTQAPAILNA